MKQINYGKVLEKSIKKKGISKKAISLMLKISRSTLYARLKDGEFTFCQMIILREENLI
jgi:predicted DNA-binding transcriptional regulator AlpA